MSRAALFASGALGVAVATADCNVAPQALPPYGQPPFEIWDSTSNGAPSVVATDTGDASTSSADSADSSNTSDIAVTDAASEVSIPVEAQDAIDESPSVVAMYGAFAPVDAKAETTD